MKRKNHLPASVSARLEKYRQDIKKQPKNYTLLFQYGVALSEHGLYAESAETLMNLVKMGAEQHQVYDACALALNRAGRPREAVTVLKAGLDKFPHHLPMMMNMADILLALKELDYACKIMDVAIEMAPDNIDLYMGYGSVLIRARQHEKAIEILEKGLEIDPEYAPIHNNLGSVYIHSRNYVKAAEHLLIAARKEPGRIEVLFNLGMSFEGMEKFDMAIQFFDEALKIDPDYAMAKCCKASVLCKHGMAQEAEHLYDEGLGKLSRDKSLRDGQFLMHYSNWIFYSHYIPGRARQKIYDDIKLWNEMICGDIKERARSGFKNAPDPDRKLKIGVISSCITRHPATQMTVRAVENINKDLFSLFLYNDTEPSKGDDYSQRYIKAFDVVRETFSSQNRELADMMEKDGIDILLELTGHSEGGQRLQLIAQRAAPVQVKWVGGLFNTSGLTAMDWMLADEIEVPQGDDDWYTERIYRLPEDYIVYDPPPYVSDVQPLPALKNGYVTFGNFNNLSKTNVFSIALWARILKAVPNSRLLLKVRRMDTPFAKQYVEEAFARHGIGLDRLILEPGEKHKAFMEAYNRLDIALDPHPYTGGLTTCEALWMGVPVITLPGETFAGRHAASHLTTAGYADWIAKSEDDYVDIAVKWANDLEGLSKLRQGMREQVAASPLVDGARFARHLEEALRFMWKDWCELKTGKSKNPAGKKKSKK